jgi:hypothetical protein
MELKDIIAGNKVYFDYYRKGFLYYTVYYNGRKWGFPVPISDTGDATFPNVDKAIFFMRYIRKAFEEKTFIEI